MPYLERFAKPSKKLTCCETIKGSTGERYLGSSIKVPVRFGESGKRGNTLKMG